MIVFYILSFLSFGLSKYLNKFDSCGEIYYRMNRVHGLLFLYPDTIVELRYLKKQAVSLCYERTAFNAIYSGFRYNILFFLLDSSSAFL